MNRYEHQYNTYNNNYNFGNESTSYRQPQQQSKDFNIMENTINTNFTNSADFTSTYLSGMNRNNIEDSLNMINFKLNFDILQNKIARLTSLIPNSPSEVTTLPSDRSNKFQAKPTEARKVVQDYKVLLNNSSIKVPSQSLQEEKKQTIATKVDYQILNTKEKINYYLKKYNIKKSKGDETNVNQNTINTLTMTHCNNNSMGSRYKSVNSVKSFKIKDTTNLLINTSLTKTDLLTESVQQFCISPSLKLKHEFLLVSPLEDIIIKQTESESENLSDLVDNILDYKETSTKINVEVEFNGESKDLVQNLKTGSYTTVYDRFRDGSSNEPQRKSDHLDNLLNNYNKKKKNSHDRDKDCTIRKNGMDKDKDKGGNKNSVSSRSSVKPIISAACEMDSLAIFENLENIETPVKINTRSRNFNSTGEKLNQDIKTKSKSPSNKFENDNNISEECNFTQLANAIQNLEVKDNLNENSINFKEKSDKEIFSEDKQQEKITEKNNSKDKEDLIAPTINNPLPEQNEDLYDEDMEASLIIQEIINSTKSEYLESTENEIKEFYEVSHNLNKEVEANNIIITDQADLSNNESSELLRSIKSSSEEDLQEAVGTVDNSPSKFTENIEASSNQHNCNELSESSQKKVFFSHENVTISYQDTNIVQDLYIIKEDGNKIKHRRRNYAQFRNLLKIKKRPKSILSKKSSIQDEKAEALERLNDLINECENDKGEEEEKEENLNLISFYKLKSPPTKIMKRNIKLVQEIENARKKGTCFRKMRSPTPRKPKKKEHCKKFQSNPMKFFSKPPCEMVLKALDLKVEPVNSNNMYASTDLNFNGIRPFSNESNDDLMRVCKSEENSPDKQERKGQIREMISHLNIEESLAKMENESRKMLDIDDNKSSSESLTSIPEVNSPDKSNYSGSPKKYRKQSL